MLPDADAQPMPSAVVLVHGGAGRSRRRGSVRVSPICSPTPDARSSAIDLLGHGTAPKPHEPDAYADLTPRVVEALPDRPVDAIGFSLGAHTLLRSRDRRSGSLPAGSCSPGSAATCSSPTMR